MCRLFGLQAAGPVRATFWLLDASDSLVTQSHRAPDGAGIGIFTADGQPVIEKQPIAAWQDKRFATAARELSSPTFLAHVRYASTGGHTVANTHPFTQDGRIFAHNGVFKALSVLDQRLAELDARGLVGGETDSERMFALITAETRVAHGDVSAGLVAAVTWIVSELPLYSLNLILATPQQMWALRYPDTHELWLLNRTAGGHRGQQPLDAASRRISARSADLDRQRAVIIASEPMDDDPSWRPLEPGELVTVAPDLSTDSTFPFPRRATHQLTLADLDATSSASQEPSKPTK